MNGGGLIFSFLFARECANSWDCFTSVGNVTQRKTPYPHRVSGRLVSNYSWETPGRHFAHFPLFLWNIYSVSTISANFTINWECFGDRCLGPWMTGLFYIGSHYIPHMSWFKILNKRICCKMLQKASCDNKDNLFFPFTTDCWWNTILFVFFYKDIVLNVVINICFYLYMVYDVANLKSHSAHIQYTPLPTIH